MRRAALLGLALSLLAAAGCGSAHRRTAATTTTTGTTDPALRGDTAATTSQLGPWHLIGHTSAFGPAADEGVATVGGQVRYAGDLTVSGALQAAGWDHVGDPDAAGADLIEPFQSSSARAKLFVTVAPNGTQSEAVHPLASGEESANSFVAVSPNGGWMVSGEYGTERRLLQFPVPTGATTDLPLAGNIVLDRPVVDLQGCAFVSGTRLVCDSDDTAADDPVLQVDLATPLAGRSVDATVTDLGPAPRVSRCAGTWEPEGMDYDRSSGVLRLEIVPPAPCSATVTIYEYRTG